MENIQYLELLATGPLIEQTENLFVRMYAYMNENGLLLPLVPGGEKMWSKSILPMLGKFGVVWVAHNGKDSIGFAQGMIKVLPNYLGGKKVGIISHVFVNSDMRKYGIGSELVSRIEEWFVAQQVDSIELQVLYQNEIGRDFWNKNCYEYELCQMRKFITGASK